MTPDTGGPAITNLRRTWRQLSGRRGRALRSARVLDDVVDAQVAEVPRLSERSRERAARHLAELVLLAHAYRRYAAGRMSRGQLLRRSWRASERLEALRRSRVEHLTERE